MDTSNRLSDQEREAVARKLADGWRMRCPHGHASLNDNDGPSVYCSTCNEGYHYAGLVDARESRARAISPPGQRYHDN